MIYSRETQRQYQEYKKRCNTFFMQLVARLCFEGNTPPSDEVITKLLDYVIHSPRGDEQLQSRRPHVLQEEGSIDPTPVVRLFLLQLMLRARYDLFRCEHFRILEID